MTTKLAIVITSATILVVSFIPTIAALLWTQDGWHWTGLTSRNTGDLNGYLSMVEEIRQDGLRTRNLFTAEPHPAFQIRPLFAVLGLTGKFLPHTSNIVLMEMGRLLANIALIFILYKLSQQITATTRERIVCLFVIAFSSGLDWMGLTSRPMYLQHVESSTFLVLLSPPLFSISLFLLLGIIFLLQRAWSMPSLRASMASSLLCGVMALWLGLDRPFGLGPLALAVVSGVTVVSIYSRRFRWDCVIKAFPLAAGAVISLTYQYTAMTNIPIYADWNRQHIIPTPDPVRLAVALGALIPFAVIGGSKVIKTAPYLGILVIAYVISSVIFAYQPFPMQERFLEGMPACTALLASAGLLHVFRMLSTTPQRFAFAATMIVLLLPTSILALRQDLQILARKQAPQYLPEPMFQAMRQVKQLASPDEPVLSTHATGNFIPAYSGRPVVLGHRVQTASFSAKRMLVNRLFASKAEEADELLHKSGARWLFWGPEEKKTASGRFDPAKCRFLQRVFSNQIVTLYRVR